MVLAVAAEDSAAAVPAEGGDMKSSAFLNQLDDQAVAAAIRSAENRTSGEIRVFVTSLALGRSDVMTAATRQFEKLKMTATAERNGVLLFFAPRDQKFAIVGDSGIDSKCGEGFWDEIASGLNHELAGGRFTEGVVTAIHEIGESLATHFPRRDDDRNELPDRVERD